MDGYSVSSRTSLRRAESALSSRSTRDYGKAEHAPSAPRRSRARAESIIASEDGRSRPSETHGKANGAHSRRSRTHAEDVVSEEPAARYRSVEEVNVATRNVRENRSGRPVLRQDPPSFIEEQSFVRAPLNSRVDMSVGTPNRNKGKSKEESLDHTPIDVQEALILEDLLYVLMGIEGTYITHPPDFKPEEHDPLQGVRFSVSPSLDTSLRDLVERILPLCTYYTAVSSFIELRSHIDFGLVNHALCAAMRDMLKDYETLVTQLEHAFNTSPSFSLQKLWFYVHPTVHTLSLLYQLTTQLATADAAPSRPSSPSGSSSEEDEEQRARDEALGLGGAKLKAVLSTIQHGVDSAPISVKGGEVLSILHERAQTRAGDPAARALHAALLKAAGAPYVTLLRAWTGAGALDDPYEELCVKESRSIDRGSLEHDYTDEYWERRYTLRDGSTITGPAKRQPGVPPPRAIGGRLPGGACIPPPLEGWKHKVLLAGKYLNVIRECGIEVSQDPRHKDDEDLSMEDERLYTFIEDAYTHANRTLLELLLRDQQLVPRLRSLKRYFFLSQSSFLTHFLDLAHGELRKSGRSASLVKLQSLLDLALTTDAQGEDALYREDVRVGMSPHGLYDWLLKVVSLSGEIGDGDAAGAAREASGEDSKKQILAIDALVLDYTVPFPLSLVISRKTILRYQLLFRFLLHLKHAEQSLGAMWVEQKAGPWRAQAPPGSNGEAFGAWRARVLLLRTRMLAFVQQVLAFAAIEVLEPNWRRLEEKLAQVHTVDQLLRDHVDFLDTCLKECMLTSSKLLKAYSRLIVTCSTFALYANSFTKSAGQAFAGAVTDEGDTQIAKRWDFLSKFETNFNHWFKVHLDCVQYFASSENVALLPLVVRLNSIKTTS